MADADGPLTYRNSAPLARGPIDLIGGTSLGERLRSAVAAIDGRITLTTSFGMEAQLIAHHVFTERLPIEVVTLDTGRLFPETYKVWQETEERFGVRIRAFYPEAPSVREMVADCGINGFYHSKAARLQCCNVRKVEPLGRALAGASAWVVGLRADQSRHRSSVRLAAWDSPRGLIKLAPLFDWSRDEVAAECARLEVPVNALHAEGYPSIGCEPCTRAVQAGEEERAGRWWWEVGEAKECGLHMAGAELPLSGRAA
jgi:phosphoadenosine phosphosulfate reductase